MMCICKIKCTQKNKMHTEMLNAQQNFLPLQPFRILAGHENSRNNAVVAVAGSRDLGDEDSAAPQYCAVPRFREEKC